MPDAANLSHDKRKIITPLPLSPCCNRTYNSPTRYRPTSITTDSRTMCCCSTTAAKNALPCPFIVISGRFLRWPSRSSRYRSPTLLPSSEISVLDRHETPKLLRHDTYRLTAPLAVRDNLDSLGDDPPSGPSLSSSYFHLNRV